MDSCLGGVVFLHEGTGANEDFSESDLHQLEEFGIAFEPKGQERDEVVKMWTVASARSLGFVVGVVVVCLRVFGGFAVLDVLIRSVALGP